MQTGEAALQCMTAHCVPHVCRLTARGRPGLLHYPGVYNGELLEDSCKLRPRFCFASKLYHDKRTALHTLSGRIYTRTVLGSVRWSRADVARNE